MSEDRIKESLAEILEFVETGGRFVGEQAPLVVQEIISWGYASHITAIVLSVVVTSLVSYMVIHTVTNCKEERLLVILGVWAFAALPIIFNLYDLLKLHFAPRLYVLDTLRGLF